VVNPLNDCDSLSKATLLARHFISEDGHNIQSQFAQKLQVIIQVKPWETSDEQKWP
jgi:hypothetical protein